MSDKQSAPTAALIIIGNEILSGRTQDTNLKYLAETLLTKGIRIVEVRVIPDVEPLIIATVNEMRAKVDYLFTTGGIGPTHDDITAEAIARAFHVPLTLNADARKILLSYYGSEDQLTPPRLKMAHVPEGARLILNPVSGAPGFNIANVYVMAGVPKIMQAMLDDVMISLQDGPQILSKTIACNLGESALAEALTAIQADHGDIEIGSYPQYKAGVLGVSLVARGVDGQKIDEVVKKIRAMIVTLGGAITAEF